MTLVYCNQDAIKITKVNTKTMTREFISSGVVGGRAMRDTAPIDKASPNIRSDKDSIRFLGIGPRRLSSATLSPPGKARFKSDRARWEDEGLSSFRKKTTMYLEYFEIPRRISFNQLSKSLSQGKSTVNENLRKAESRLVSRFLRDENYR